ncbi:GH12094 [Drosophila grimshawi]|uniref:GH12094 n=1 Tax=Drosophila grimshawi TaxID=7222 RepID=B4JK89_DROGR|nr:GH12094 [Drosophila grimshawi]
MHSLCSECLPFASPPALLLMKQQRAEHNLVFTPITAERMFAESRELKQCNRLPLT